MGNHNGRGNREALYLKHWMNYASGVLKMILCLQISKLLKRNGKKCWMLILYMLR